LVTGVLFEKYPTVQDSPSLIPKHWRTTSEVLVLSTPGPVSSGAAKKVVNDFGGQGAPNDAGVALVAGVDEQDANVCSDLGYGIATAVDVDTQVYRISWLELTKSRLLGKDRARLMKGDSAREGIDFAHQLIWHGQRLCFARKPNCAE